jgi:hypothetical protein
MMIFEHFYEIKSNPMVGPTGIVIAANWFALFKKQKLISTLADAQVLGPGQAFWSGLGTKGSLIPGIDNGVSCQKREKSKLTSRPPGRDWRQCCGVSVLRTDHVAWVGSPLFTRPFS